MFIFIAMAEKADKMAKRRSEKKTKGKSARRGNAPAPYTRYDKQPYRYSAEYYAWVRTVKGRAAKSNNKYATEAQASR